MSRLKLDEKSVEKRSALSPKQAKERIYAFLWNPANVVGIGEKWS